MNRLIFAFMFLVAMSCSGYGDESVKGDDSLGKDNPLVLENVRINPGDDAPIAWDEDGTPRIEGCGAVPELMAYLRGYGWVVGDIYEIADSSVDFDRNHIDCIPGHFDKYYFQQDGVSVREYINYRLEQPDEAYLYWDHIYDWQEDGTLRDEDGKFLMRVVFVGEKEFQAIIHLGSRIVEREPLVTKEVYGLADFVRMTDEELDACRKKYDKEYFEYMSKQQAVN